MTLWVVEMWNEPRQRWEPTVGVKLTRDGAREELARWQRNNPSDRFRLWPYVSRDAIRALATGGRG